MNILKLKNAVALASILLIQSCNGEPKEQHEIVGLWKGKCIIKKGGDGFRLKTLFTSDRKFYDEVSAFGHGLSFSGTYKISRRKLKMVITESSDSLDKDELPITEITNIEWLNKNSYIESADMLKCTMIRSPYDS